MTTPVERGRTAMSRTALSRPMARAMADGLLDQGDVFDFGCGRGGDLRRLRELGVNADGFDPVHRAHVPPQPADTVNLGFVLNVIEDVAERSTTLRCAWGLARRLLVVSARLLDERPVQVQALGDGVITSTGTFQRFYRQAELAEYIAAELGVEPVAAAPGIFYVFRSPAEHQAFLLSRVRRAPRSVGVSAQAFDQHRELLESLMDFHLERGRLPRAGEWTGEAESRELFGTPRQAFQIVRRVTGDEPWDRARVERSEDLLVYLALGRLNRRSRMGELPDSVQIDIRDLFGSYAAACRQADRLLLASGEEARFREASHAASVGKLTPSALYVHVSALDRLAPVLRVREGCARVLLGEVDEATLVKLHLDSARVSYLSYPEFERDPHPALAGGYVVALDSLRAQARDYRGHVNPPILHRKELFVAEDHPARARFARLTQQEARAGLYRDPSRIGTRRGWERVLAESGVRLRGHRIVRTRPSPEADGSQSGSSGGG